MTAAASALMVARERKCFHLRTYIMLFIERTLIMVPRMSR